MAAGRGATALLVCLLLVSVAAAGVGAVSATPDGDTVDDENSTADTTGTTDAVDNTTDAVDDTTTTTDPGDNTTDTVDDTTDDTTDTVENTTDATTDAVQNTTGTSDTTDTVGDTTTETTNTTAETTNTTTDAVENTTTATTDTVGETTDALSGTLSARTDTTVSGLVGTTSTVLGTASGVSAVEETDSESTRDTRRRESGDWTRQQHSVAGDSTAADTANSRSEPDSQARPNATPHHLPLPEGAAATTAFVAGLVAIARPTVVAPGGVGMFARTGAGRLGTAAANRVTAGFDGVRRFLVPLRYSRYDDSDPLDHETRAALYDAIDAQPGVYLSDLCERADVNISTARHHVRVLEDEQLVTSAKPRGKRRYYPAAADDHELAAALSEPATAAVLEALADLGTAHVGLLADELDRDPSTVSHHLQRLADDGLVVRERDGRAVVNRLADPVEDAIAGSRTPEPAVADD